jgi:hydrogenase maturation protease
MAASSTKFPGLDSTHLAMARVLIVAYGNPLRSDDGVAWHAAQILEQGRFSSQVEILCVHQLMPELAEAVSRADGVLFLDAAENGEPGEISCAPVIPESSEQPFTHVFTPAQIIALCERVYGCWPSAFAVSIAGESFDHGDALSATLKNALPRLIETVEELIARLAGSA